MKEICVRNYLNVRNKEILEKKVLKTIILGIGLWRLMLIAATPWTRVRGNTQKTL
jgi:hypothetical protein